MAKFYHLAALKQGEGIAFTDATMRVDLSRIHAVVENDEQLLSAAAKDTYFYLSGGGSLLLNGRYLLIVQREAGARINPGQWSLFTGRADTDSEWQQPNLLARELFEELQLFLNGARVRFTYAPLQSLIDQAQHYEGQTVAVALTPRTLPAQRLLVEMKGKTLLDQPAFLHINRRNDINCVELFEASVDIEILTARDAEHDREIATLDLETGQLRMLGGQNAVSTEKLPMSEHLQALVEHLQIRHNKA